MNWLFEQPIVIVMVGVAVVLALAGAWSATGRRELLYGVGAALVLLIAGLIVERMVVTDREAIRETLARIARDVQSNNRRAVVQHIAMGASSLKQKAEAELPNYKFTECRVTKVHSIDVNSTATPPTAIARFNVIASGSFSYGGVDVSDSQVPRWIELQMVKEKDGRWAVEDYSHAPPQQMLFDRSLGEGR
jgi:hypothetical protein